MRKKWRKSQKVQNEKVEKCKMKKKKKLKKTLNQRTFLIFYWIYGNIFLLGLKKN